jgi:predicted permease
MIAHLRLTLRRLGKSPGFTAITLATLAVCIGANLAIFAVVNSVLLRPLPFPDADQLVTVYNSYPKAGIDRGGSSVTSYYERRGVIPAFSSISDYQSDHANLGEGGSVSREEIFRVTPDFFATLGVRLTEGRTFNEDEMTFQAANVAVLTDSYWRQQYNADPKVLGQKVRVNGVAKTIIGVLPQGFRFLSSNVQVFLPLASDSKERGIDRRYSGNAEMIGRLRPGYGVSTAQSQIDAHNAAHAAEYPYAREVAAAGFRSFVAPLQADHVHRVRSTLLMLQGGALLLLVIGTVNIVNLLLIRASARAKEFAIRQSLGASVRHVSLDVLIETVTLTLMGGILGLILGAFFIRMMGLLGVNQLPLGSEVRIDQTLMFVAVAAAVLLGVVIAIPIIWFNVSNHLANALKAESRGGTAGRGAQRLRNGFIVAQIALAFVLLAWASQLGASLKRAMAVNPGFRADHVLTGEVSLPWETYKDNAVRLEFTDRLLEKLQHLPGMASVGVVTSLPLQGMSSTNNTIILGRTPKVGEPPNINNTYGVDGDYFAAMGIPLVEGRLLEAADSHRKERICVVDVNYARRYWPNGGAVGQRFYLGLPQTDPSMAFTIVGVVGSVKQDGLTESHALDAIYFPFGMDTSNVEVVASTSMAPDFLASSLRSAVRDIDPEIPVHDIRSMDERISESLATQRSPVLLCGIFSAVSLLLAGMGTYGVLAYAVAQRHREIGVRIALGAEPVAITRLFLLIGLRQLAIGIVLGIAGTAVVGRIVGQLLFEAPPFPMGTLVSTAVVIAAVSLAACLIPSRRAAKVSPMEALGSD